jgi:PKD repeat protein
MSGGTIGSDQSICYSGNPGIFTNGGSPAGGNGAWTYDWEYQTGCAGGWTSLGINALTYDIPAGLTATRCYRRTATNSCGTVYSNTVTVTVYADMSGGTIGSDQTICYSGDPTAFTNTGAPAGGDGIWTYNWEYQTGCAGGWTSLGENALTYDIPSGLTSTRCYRRVATNGCGTVYSNIVTVTVYANMVGGTISSDRTICYNTDVPAFGSVTAASGGDGIITYTWQYTINMSAVPGDGAWTDIATSNSTGYDYGTLTSQTRFVRKAVDGTCGVVVYSNMITVSINPLPVTSAISGDALICATATSKLYQVDSHSGTKYTWSVPAAILSMSFNLDMNFILVDATGTIGSGDIQVYETIIATGCVSSPKTLTVNVSAVATGVVPTGLSDVCLGASGVSYEVPDNPGSTYSWSLPPFAYITSDPSLHQVLVTFPSVVSGQVTAIETNGGCTTYHLNRPVTVHPLPTPTITGPATACEASTGNTYITETGMTGYIWSVSTGGSITSGATTNSITVTWNTPGPQTVFVNYTNANGCTAASPTAKSVTVYSLPLPTLTGNASVCKNSSGNLYSTEAGMTNYIWTVSAGGTITAGGISTSNSVTVTWGSTGAQSVSVSYTNGNGCVAASPTVKAVTVNVLPVPTISGPTPICKNSSGNVYTTEPGMTNYLWSVSAGGVITSGGTSSNTITVTWSTAGAQTVGVNYTNANGCTALTPTAYPVTVNALPVPTIGGPAPVCVNSSGNIYYTESGMTSYLWTISSGGIITAGTGTHSITVTWNTTGAQTVGLNYTDGNGCTAATPVSYSVTVNPLPVPVITGDAAACVTSSGKVYSTQSGMSSYAWTISSGGTITAGAGTNSITVNWTATGAQTITVNYTNGNGCQAATPATKNITVNPLPAPSITGNSSVCINSAGNVYTTEGGMTNYTWVVSSGGTITALGGTSNNSVVVTWSTAGAQSVSVNYTNSNNCTAAAPAVKTVTVNPLPVPVITGPASVCVSSTGNIYSTEAGMTSYIWTVSSGGTITDGAGTSSIKVTWSTSGERTVSVAYTNLNGCTASPPSAYNVTVHPLPVPAITGPETACVTSAGNSYSTEPGMSGYLWSVSAGGTITSGTGTNSIAVTWNVTGLQTVSVNYTNSSGCTAASATVYNVTVNAQPSILTFVPSAPVCEFSIALYKVTAAGSSLTYQWYVNDRIAGFVPTSDLGGTYYGSKDPTLQIYNPDRSMNGYIYRVVVSACGTNVTSVSDTLRINTAPEITIHPADTIVCLGANAVMSAEASGIVVAWQWYVNKGAGGFLPVVADANFTGQTTKTLTITNAQSSFNNWIFRAKATGLCGAPVNTNFGRLSVTNPPIVTLHPKAAAICQDGSTSFLGNGTNYTGMKWQVSTDNGAVYNDVVDDDIIYMGSLTNQLSIMDAGVTMNGNRYRLALIGSCTTKYSDAVILTVNPNPVVDFSAADTINACGGVPIVINGNPSGGTLPYVQHRWTGDIGALNSYTIASPVFNSQLSGTYNLNYKVTDSKGCFSNDDLAVLVDSPSATFTHDVNTGCTALTVNFSKDMTGIEKFWWDFRDGSPIDSVTANPVHVFTNTDPSSIEYHNVKLTVRSAGGCFDTFTSLVTVYPEIDATFTASRIIVCSGNSITFTSLPGASKYFWEYGDGAGYATNTSMHLYTNRTTEPIIYQVKLTTTSFYNCTDVKTIDITVMPVPLPQFTAVPASQIYDAAGNPVTFTNTTNAGTWDWLWRFGDGATSTDKNPVHTYTALGNFDVWLVVRNTNCSDSLKHPVSVVPKPPIANFDSIPSGCEPLSISIHNTSLNTEIPGTTFRWDFGDGSISTAKNPTYTYFDAGTYRVELTISGPGGVDSKSQVIHSYPSPKAYFEISPLFVFANDEKVRAFNLSTEADSYLWEFGDGDTSKVKEPFHRYMETGVFDITLWAYSNNGCSDKYILSPGVTVEPAGDVRFSTVFTPNLDGPIDRTDLPTGGTEIDQFFFPPIREKVTNYKLQVFNRLGVLIFESRDINTPWNGYYKGTLCQQGVYIWYVEGKYANGQPFKKVGDVTLLH